MPHELRVHVACVAALAAVLASTASAAPNFVIRRDNDIGGFALARNGTLGGAIAVYGAPTTRQAVSYDTCTVAWARYGIQAEFSLPSANPCDNRSCHTRSTITGRQWKTDKGLHIGDPLPRLRRFYPHAKAYVGKTWTLTSRPFGGARVPTLLATVKAGRIAALVIRSPWLLTC